MEGGSSYAWGQLLKSERPFADPLLKTPFQMKAPFRLPSKCQA